MPLTRPSSRFHGKMRLSEQAQDEQMMFRPLKMARLEDLVFDDVRREGDPCWDLTDAAS